MPVSEELTDFDIISQVTEMPDDSNNEQTPIAISLKEAPMAAEIL